MFREVMVNQSNTSGDAWQQIGDQSSSQLHTTGLNGAAVSTYYRYIESDAVITDGSFIRLKIFHFPMIFRYKRPLM
jgi:hypothetical protein